MKKVKIKIKDSTVNKGGCPEGQLRPGKGNKNDEC